MRPFCFLAALPLLVSASASAWSETTLLIRATTPGNETSCESGDKACGIFCIPSDYTCCPDLEGGCPSATSVCMEGDNGIYGCCGKDEYCQGDGGSEFIDDGADGSSSGSSNGTTATRTGDSTSGADVVVFGIGQGLTFAAVMAGIVVLV
ncbi:hypothetical protein A1O1_00748 [Capronia coronata CBS 617.96]|uniref:Granulins domain-containing protein n=1 Tax=Capronia coronata CBS 617.96 TaxID=1182541 RepID=W9Z227_9EURO|nr:uncharacterized protein A1O1_00748 [Capronia coronata CBS 617.96]EXJ95626.1 hypothetical protein A1O1_00748 [Capronia coronata CBS 617.96]